METQQSHKQEREQGFTLIELLIAMVVVGVLTTVAIVGIGGLVNNGSNSACQASADAAKAATAVHYSNTTPNAYPSSFGDMMTTSPKELDVPDSVTNPTDTTLQNGDKWTLTMNNPGAATITYTCSTTTPAT